MEQSLERTIALLERTPRALDAMLRGLPEEWTRSDEGEGTWSAFDVVAHLINCERTDWVPRARTILESKDGELRGFPPFDRLAGIRESQGMALGELLDTFAQERAESVRAVREWGLSAEQLRMRGKHPALGEVTLSELMATWAAHDLNHLHQISRVMAHQYREAVGPWSQYLGVMLCDAHSA